MFPPRALVTAAALVALTLGAGACGSSGSKAAAATATTTATSVDLSTVTLRIGDQGQAIQTLFETSGQSQGTPYHLEWDGFTDGPHMNAGFSANKIDAGYMGDTPAIFAGAARAGVTVVATAEATQQSNGYYQLLARPGSGIKTLADLKGKKVAFTKSTALEGYVLAVLHSVHLGLKDITAVDVPIATLAATLASGNVDAAISFEPATDVYLAKTPGAIQLTVPLVKIYSVELASQKSLADPAKRAALLDFIARLVKAETWRQAHGDQWVKAYYVDKLHVPEVAGQKIFATIGHYRYVQVVGSGLDTHLKDQQTLLQDAGELPPSDSVAGLFNRAVNAAFDKAIAAAAAGAS